MNKNNSNLKNNLIKLATFLSLVLLSAFLLMAAINMLNMSNSGAGGDGGGTDRESSSDGNNNRPTASRDYNDNNNNNNSNRRNEDWHERVEKRRAERKSSESFGEGQQGEEYPSEEYPNGEYPNGDFTVPDNVPNIDISGDNTVPDIPFGSGEDGGTIKLTDEDVPHTPVFEVLGYPNYPFLKVMVMEKYSNNRWIAVEEQPEVIINFDEYIDENYSVNSVKIKPIIPSNGYLPVLSGNINFKYRTSVNRYKISETYYSEEAISDFYSMEYENPVDYDHLVFANTDDSYPYSMSVPEDIDRIVDDIIEDCNSDFDVIEGVERYLLENYQLRGDVINNYGQNDGIRSFLMNRWGSGNTLDFMSAYTYLLNAAGIPCRLAVGYRINPDKPYQVVYRDQTYIYPEIKFEKYGWVPMDVFGYDPTFTPPIETVTQITSVTDEAKRGTNFTVRGTVTDYSGTALDDMSVLIYVKPSKTENTLSYAKAEVHGGNFEVTCDIKPSTNAGKYQVVADLLENDLYRTSTSDPEMRITTDTRMEIGGTDTVIGNSFKVEGQLLDSYSNEGIAGQSVDIKYLGADIADSVITGDDGRFSKIVGLNQLESLKPDRNFFFVKGYNIHYNAEFMGNEIFYPSNAGSKIYIWHILWMRIVLALLVLAAVFALLILIKVLRRRNLGTENMKLALEGNISDSADFTPEFEQTLIRDIKVQIFISFPQIKNGYPDVWGIGDELVVYFEDSWQNRDEIRMTFDNKGVYSIKVSEGTDSITNRDIRIVDYREEVIANGKLLLKEFSKSIEIDDKMTLREILFLMKSKLTNMKYLILDEIFTILEKAVYSLSDIKRDDYELFYMCIQKFKSME